MGVDDTPQAAKPKFVSRVRVSGGVEAGGRENSAVSTSGRCGLSDLPLVRVPQIGVCKLANDHKCMSCAQFLLHPFGGYEWLSSSAAEA